MQGYDEETIAGTCYAWIFCTDYCNHDFPIRSRLVASWGVIDFFRKNSIVMEVHTKNKPPNPGSGLVVTVATIDTSEGRPQTRKRDIQITSPLSCNIHRKKRCGHKPKSAKHPFSTNSARHILEVDSFALSVFCRP